jgi:tRNA dimethylallyltransferase
VFSSRVIFLTGPTSSGKTKFGITLAKHYSGEIINADARQLYRDAPIGTGVPTGEWRLIDQKSVYHVEGVPHHLMAVSEPDQAWTVSSWCEQAKACLEDVWSRSRVPIVVGGTGLYVRALSEGYVFSGEPDKELRERLLALSPEVRLQQLLELDPRAKSSTDHRNPHRVLRALERRLSGLPAEPMIAPPTFSSLKLGIQWPSEVLKMRVTAAVHTQFEKGWVQEVRELIDRGIPLSSPLMMSIGFRTIAQCFSENSSLEAMEQEVVQATWQYVRRQMTWSRKEPNLRWLDGEDPFPPAASFIASFLSA